MSKKQYELSELVPGKLINQWHDEIHNMHALAPDGSPACGRQYRSSTGAYPDSTLADVQCGTCRRIVIRAFGFERNNDDDWTLKLPDHGLELLVPTNGEPDAIVCDGYDRVRYRKVNGASHWLGALAVWALACANGEDTASDEPAPTPEGGAA